MNSNSNINTIQRICSKIEEDSLIGYIFHGFSYSICLTECLWLGNVVSFRTLRSAHKCKSFHKSHVVLKQLHAQLINPPPRLPEHAFCISTASFRVEDISCHRHTRPSDRLETY